MDILEHASSVSASYWRFYADHKPLGKLFVNLSVSAWFIVVAGDGLRVDVSLRGRFTSLLAVNTRKRNWRGTRLDPVKINYGSKANETHFFICG